MTPQRVLHVHSTFAPGGKELRSVRLINAFGDAAEHVILSAVPGQYGARDAIAPGIKAQFPSDAPALAGPPSLARYRALAAFMRGFDLVLTYNWGAMDMVAARRLFPWGCPLLIHHEDGFNADEAEALLWRRSVFRRMMLPTARAVVVPSRTLEAIAHETWRLKPGHVRYIANGIPVEDYAQPAIAEALPAFAKQADEVVIGTVAGLRPVKNIARLIQSFALVRAKARLVIVGDGPDRPRLEALIQSLGLAGRAVLAGHHPNPQRFLHQFDVFALSSESEQAPLSLMEAMAAGLPVAALDVGDVRTMVAEQNRDFIARKGDGVGLAHALDALAANPGLRRILGLANQIKARVEFDDSRMIASYATLYGIGDPSAFLSR